MAGKSTGRHLLRAADGRIASGGLLLVAGLEGLGGKPVSRWDFDKVVCDSVKHSESTLLTSCLKSVPAKFEDFG